MGIYIETGHLAKAPAIAKHAERVTQQQFLDHTPFDDGKVGVGVVDNGPFEAAAIAYSAREAADFTRVTDTRRKLFFIIPVASIAEIDKDAAKQLERYVLAT